MVLGAATGLEVWLSLCGAVVTSCCAVLRCAVLCCAPLCAVPCCCACTACCAAHSLPHSLIHSFDCQQETDEQTDRQTRRHPRAVPTAAQQPRNTAAFPHSFYSTQLHSPLPHPPLALLYRCHALLLAGLLVAHHCRACDLFTLFVLRAPPRRLFCCSARVSCDCGRYDFRQEARGEAARGGGGWRSFHCSRLRPLRRCQHAVGWSSCQVEGDECVQA